MSFVAKVFVFIIFGLVLTNILYCQQIRAIPSEKIKSIFIGCEFRTNKNEKVKIELFSKDSTFHKVIFDSVLEKNKSIKIVDQEEISIFKKKYPNDIVIQLPCEKSGFYFYKYTKPDTVYIQKFLNMK